MIRLTTIVVLALGLIATPSLTQEAEACSCFPSTVSSSYQSYDQVVRVRVGKLLKSSDNFTSRYSGNVLEAFKGCLSGSVIIETASNGATCGLGLTRGEWLLNGYLTASKGGTPTNIATAYVEDAFGDVGTELSFAVRDKHEPCVVTELPFYKRAR